MRTRLLGIGFLGVLAASLVLAGGSAAENLKMLPEVGRCQLVSKGTGEFRGSKCTRAEPRSNYSWLSGTGAKNKFTGVMREPEFKTPTKIGEGMDCHSGTFSGQYTDPKNLTIEKITFTGCSSAFGKCENKVGSPIGEVTTGEMLGELAFISHPTKLKAGWNLKPASGSPLSSTAFASYECGATEVPGTGVSAGAGAPGEITGSVIGYVENLSKPAQETLVNYAIKKGVQFPEKFEGGVKDTLTTVVTEKLPGTGKQSLPTVLVTHLVLKNEEPLEVRGRCAGTSC